MKTASLCALFMGATIVLTSFALTRGPSTTGGPAWTVSQYQLDRAFRHTFTLGMPMSMQMPSTGGIVITQVRVVTNCGNCGTLAEISVNGATETIGQNAAYPHGYQTLDPPIIVRPNEILTISGPGGVLVSETITLAGYTTLPGET
jgi:hypothetical protein